MYFILDTSSLFDRRMYLSMFKFSEQCITYAFSLGIDSAYVFDYVEEANEVMQMVLSVSPGLPVEVRSKY